MKKGREWESGERGEGEWRGRRENEGVGKTGAGIYCTVNTAGTQWAMYVYHKCSCTLQHVMIHQVCILIQYRRPHL